MGFKKDHPTFKEYLTTLEREPASMDIPRGPIKDKDLYPLDGRDQAFVVMDGTYTNFKQGNLRVTQAPLDLALDGPGYFEVSTPAGIRYTRQGSLKVAGDGKLVTADGNPVLASEAGGLASAQPATAAVQPSQGGLMTQGGVAAGQLPPEVAARTINVGDYAGPISITENGEVHVGEQLVARLNVVEFVDKNRLRKTGGHLFLNTDEANIIPLGLQPQATRVRQGMLETSNVNPAEEMANMLRAQRSYEMNLKSMKTYDDLMGREANDIGKL